MVSDDGTATGDPHGFLLPGKHDKRICEMLGKTSHGILLWGLFFLICFGLGYPSLNRYDPRLAGNPDSAEYYKIVEGNPQAVPDHFRFRVLVPYLAKPFYWLAKGRVGTWNPVFFGLLVANSIFSATSACLLVIIGYKVLNDYGIALVGALLYLVSFNVPNHHLAGLIDSGEACLMLAVSWAIVTDRWSVLPIFGMLGALAKESIVPAFGVFSLTWLLTAAREEGFRLSRLAWVLALAIVGFGTVTILRSTASGHMVWPWDIALAERTDISFIRGLYVPFLDREFWYVFAWLLPLGVWRLRCLPRPWVYASFTASLLMLIFGAWHNAGITGSGVARAMFDTAGPVLSLSVASLLLRKRPQLS